MPMESSTIAPMIIFEGFSTPAPLPAITGQVGRWSVCPASTFSRFNWYPFYQCIIAGISNQGLAEKMIVCGKDESGDPVMNRLI